MLLFVVVCVCLMLCVVVAFVDVVCGMLVCIDCFDERNILCVCLLLCLFVAVCCCLLLVVCVCGVRCCFVLFVVVDVDVLLFRVCYCC